MVNFVKNLRWSWIVPAVIFTIVVTLAANMHPLWGDEAETALFARNILQFGLPKGWDGVNIMGINNAAVLDKNLVNHTSPWAQYYLVALSFKLFGQSSFTARLPSIIIAILTIPLIYILAVSLTKSRKIAFLASFFLSLSVQYILFAYQARYYILTDFCGLIFFYAAYLLPSSNWKTKLLFIGSGIIFFYANYVSFLSFYVATFLALFFYRLIERESLRQIAKKTGQFGLLSVFIVFFTVPWVMLFKPLQSRGELMVLPFNDLLQSFGILFIGTLNDSFNFSNVFPLGFYFLFFIVVLVYIIRRVSKSLKLVLFLACIPLFYLFNMTVITASSYVDTVFVSTRYTTVIIPFLILLAAVLIHEVLKFQKWLGVALIFVYLFTNLLTFNPPRSYLLDLLGEIAHPYATPDILVARHLQAYAHLGDTAFVNLDRDHEPLIFYLNQRVRFVNRVSLTNTRIFPKNRAIIPRYIYDFRGEPDWVIYYSHRVDPDDFATFDLRALPPEVDLTKDYSLTVIPVYFSDLSRPEMIQRSFSAVEPSYNDQVFIFQKKANNE